MSTREFADLVVERYLRENPDDTVANASLFALLYIAYFVDSHMGENYQTVLDRRISKIKKELKEENKMRFADVKEIVITEDEISTLYKGPDCRIVKAGNKFEAIFADVPRDKISNNKHFPYITGANEGANIEKITLNDNDTIDILFTNNKVNKYTKVAIDKRGNQVLQRAVAKLFTAREKA